MTARAALLLAVAAILACTMKPGSPPARTAQRTGAQLVVVPTGARRPDTRLPVVFAEIAADNETRNRGLGGRDRIGEDAGMLFVYAQDTPHTFWMKDCLVALDIAFIGTDRRILNVATLPAAAGMPSAEVPRAHSTGPGRWVLETAAGWFEAHGLGPGDEVDLSAAVHGVVAR